VTAPPTCSLVGKIALVAGGATGIGFASTTGLFGPGPNVYIARA